MGITPQENVPLAPFTTLAVGGPARWYVECRGEDEVRLALAHARERGLPRLVLGGGSNLLVADRGFDGLVLRLLDDAFDATREGDVVRVRAGAGHDWDALVQRCVLEGWAGIECLSGIPGRAGAAPIQNIGAYGQELRETLHEVRAVRDRDGETVLLDHEACGFGYRTSVFKRGETEPMVVTRITLALRAGGAPTLRYRDLLEAIGHEASPTLAATREAVLAVRRRKSMVLDASDANTRSAGSFFLNPVVDDALADELAERAVREGLASAMPRYEAGPGRAKLSAAWLIERAGLRKGHTHGGAGISSRHVLALINRDHATAQEILELAIEVRRRVEQELGVRLVPEPNLVGFTPEETAPLRA